MIMTIDYSNDNFIISNNDNNDNKYDDIGNDNDVFCYDDGKTHNNVENV